jgi:DNA gyrase subunit A
MAEETIQKTDRIILRELEDEMKTSYLDYAMSVLVGRALPDIRDGLKPVHRRVLYTMYTTGLLHNKSYKKSANVVGNCMARYHPHGDMAIYDTLVRMAQPFSLRYPLVDGQGNFGSIDGDNAAAMRYTEVRLAKIAEEILEDIDKETVDFVPNFDGSTTEPVVLPSKLPNLLINGSSGIAVGMATNIPPHNLGEVIDAMILLIEHPDAVLEEVMTILKGPDFPTGASIIGSEGIKEAYKTGYGSLLVRAKIITETVKDKTRFIVTEIPYQINKSALIEEIAQCIRDKVIQGISDIRDESDREGMRIVIELKRDSNPDVIQAQLLTHSRLETSSSIMLVGLSNNQPKTLTLLELMHAFVNHRIEVVTRRTRFDLKKAEEKSHILEGLIVALNNIDLVIKKIRASKNTEVAKSTLINDLEISEIQAQAILDMRLQRLSALEQDKIRKENEETKELIKNFKQILESPKKIRGIIKDELLALNSYSDKRRTDIIQTEEKERDVEDLIRPEDVVVTITHNGYIKRQSMGAYKQQRRGGKGITATDTREQDFIEQLFIANTHSYLLLLTDKGILHWMKVYQIPESSRYALGKPIVNLLALDKDEHVTAYVPVKEFSDKEFLVMATKYGTIKKTNLNAFSNPRKGGILAITLEQDDKLIKAMTSDGTKKIILATSNGKALKFNEKDIRPSGRSSKGVTGIRLRKDDEVIGMEIVEDIESLLTITSNGYGKRSAISDYRFVRRGGKGVTNIKVTNKNGCVVGIKPVIDSDEIMLINKQGNIIRMEVKEITVIGRHTQGVRVMKLNSGDELKAVTKVVKETNGE